MLGFYQVADNDLRPSLDSQVERGEFGCVLNPGVNISLDTDEEQDAFNIRILHSHVEEIAPFVVNLDGNRSLKSGEIHAVTVTLEIKTNCTFILVLPAQQHLAPS